MAEPGSRRAADIISAYDNLRRIGREGNEVDPSKALDISRRLRTELKEKGLKGFKRGGKIKKTQVAKVHRGERVLTAKQAKKPAVKSALRKPAAKARRRR